MVEDRKAEQGGTAPDDGAPVDEIAGAVAASVRLLVQRLRQSPTVEHDITSSEISAMARLDRLGPATASELAKLERITAQSMGATVASLETRGLIRRVPDPADGRRVIISLTAQGERVLRRHRRARSELLSKALADGFTRTELDQLMAAAPLIERLAHSI
jgi:DNA-binding MarR family transcriptional regulator